VGVAAGLVLEVFSLSVGRGRRLRWWICLGAIANVLGPPWAREEAVADAKELRRRGRVGWLELDCELEEEEEECRTTGDGRDRGFTILET
jgi:hypothetical protein